MIKQRVSQRFFWEIMSHGAGSCYYSLQTQGLPADAQTRSWEDHSKNRNVTLRDPHSLSHLFISLRVKPGKSSLCLNEISHFVPLLIFPSLSPPQRVEAAGLRLRVSEECEVLLWVLNQAALQWFLLFGDCLFPDKLLVFLTHTNILLMYMYVYVY